MCGSEYTPFKAIQYSKGMYRETEMGVYSNSSILERVPKLNSSILVSNYFLGRMFFKLE